MTPFLYALGGSPHFRVAKYFLQQGYNIETRVAQFGQTPLSWAIHGFNNFAVQFLLENNANINAWSPTAPHTPFMQTIVGLKSVEKIALWSPRSSHTPSMHIIVDRESLDMLFLIIRNRPQLWNRIKVAFDDLENNLLQEHSSKKQRLS